MALALVDGYFGKFAPAAAGGSEGGQPTTEAAEVRVFNVLRVRL
jgi:hypothetical protein